MQEQSKTDSRGARWIFLLLAMLAIFSLARAEPAQAAAPDAIIWAKWILQVDFQNNGIDATRINQIYRNRVLLDQWSQPIPCSPVGAVTLGLDRATFSGGYVDCFLPSFRDEVAVHTGGQLMLGPTGTYGDAPNLIWGRAELGVVNVSANPMPLLSHPDHQTYWSLVDAQGNVRLKLDGGPAPMTTRSAIFGVPGADSMVRSFLGRCDGTTCRGIHALDSTLLNVQTLPQSAPWTGTTDSTTVLIGARGALRFDGEIRSIRWDPGCVVRQG